MKNPFTYKGAYGYYYDEETGLYYLKARYYDPKIYRFISRDPIEKAPELADLQNPLSLNPYVYCEDDPVGKVDPDGMFVITAPALWLILRVVFIAAFYTVLTLVAIHVARYSWPYVKKTYSWLRSKAISTYNYLKNRYKKSRWRIEIHRPHVPRSTIRRVLNSMKGSRWKKLRWLYYHHRYRWHIHIYVRGRRYTI